MLDIVAKANVVNVVLDEKLEVELSDVNEAVLDDMLDVEIFCDPTSGFSPEKPTCASF